MKSSRVQVLLTSSFLPTTILILASMSAAQVAGPNVNVISGIKDQFIGDRFLQRQNEPTIAASSRNPDHLLAAFNDYSTVDIAGDPNIEPDQEAWIGISRSYDRGHTWSHALVPGYPQDTSPAGTSSPVFGMQAGSDPVLAAGTNGRMYLGGLFFIRGGNSRIAILRYTDRNNSDSGENFFYEGTTVVDIGSASSVGAFTDKPSILADIPRAGALIPAGSASTSAACGNVYISYSVFDGTDSNGNFRSKVLFSRSLDCGVTFTKPIKLNGTSPRNQGTAIAIDPRNGNVFVVWRTFNPDSILIAKSTDQGQTFTAPTLVNTTALSPFDQPTFPDAVNPSFGPTFRSNGFPTAVADGNGNLYVAWQERVAPNGSPSPNGLPRTVITTLFSNSPSWTPRKAVEYFNDSAHQVMPSLAIGTGILRLFSYDFRADGLGLDSATGFISGLTTRTANARIAEANQPASGNPSFGPSSQVSQYSAGIANHPNYTMYQHGTVPFFGDYIQSIAALSFVGAGANSVLPWRWATQSTDTPARNSFTVWTDHRDVVVPADWTQYSPPGSGTVSCTNPGSRNANIYFSEVSPGLVAGSPGTFKQLVDASNTAIQRTFVSYVENHTGVSRFVRLTVVDDPLGTPPVIGSLLQFGSQKTVDLEILPQSSITRSVYVTSSNPTASVRVDVNEINAIGGTLKGSGGLNTSITFNGDSSNPINPQVSNTEVHTPQISNPQVSNPQVSNTAITDVGWVITNVGNTTSAFTGLTNVDNLQQLVNNGFKFQLIFKKIYKTPTCSGGQAVETIQDVQVSNITNPQVSNPQVSNPQVSNPQISNPQVSNATFFMAPTDASVGQAGALQAAAVAGDGTNIAPRLPDQLQIILRVTQTKKGGPAFDAKKNKVTQTIFAQAANTGNPDADFVSKSTQ